MKSGVRLRLPKTMYLLPTWTQTILNDMIRVVRCTLYVWTKWIHSERHLITICLCVFVCTCESRKRQPVEQEKIKKKKRRERTTNTFEQSFVGTVAWSVCVRETFYWNQIYIKIVCISLWFYSDFITTTLLN